MATTRLSSKLLKARTHARRRGASKRPAPGNGGAHDEGQAYATGSNAPTTGELQLAETSRHGCPDQVRA